MRLICLLAVWMITVMPAAGGVFLPGDWTGDLRVDLDDFSALAREWDPLADGESLDRLAFHWLMDAGSGTGVSVEAAYTDRARYEPGGMCLITVQCRNASQAAWQGSLRLNVTRLGRGVHTDRQAVSLAAGQTAARTFAWTVPATDFEGYHVEAWLDNGSYAVTAVDVSSDWKRYPRYGYVTEFYAGQSTARNTELLDELCRDYHINSLQYYDWMWRHENVILRNTAGAISDPWTDWRGAQISFGVLQDSIARANARAMAPMPYFQIYMALDNYQALSRVSPQWGLYADTGHARQYAHDAGVNMWLFNPANVQWQNHLCGEVTEALTTMHWAGVHLDQLGNIGGGVYYDYGGSAVDLEWALAAMVNRGKDHLDWLEATNPATVGRDAVIFNLVDGGVGSWAADEVLASKTDVVYSELWSNETYGGVSEFVRHARAASGRKAVVLAAYVNRDEDTGGTFDADSVLLADAAFFASGAFHLELGDGEHMLAQEFFPARDKQIGANLRRRLKDYYHFITAYERLLFAPELRFGDGGLQWIAIGGQPLSGHGAGDTIWFLNRATPEAEIFHLVNLLGNDDRWRNVAAAPPVLEDLAVKLRLGPDAQVTAVKLASPDCQGGIMQPLPYTTGTDARGAYVSVTVPRLEYWDMLYVERTVELPAGGRYEAERAIQWNTAVDTDHGGYTGSGFVDQFTEAGDSVSFVVAAPRAGNYTLRFRYANGGPAATRSVVVNGDILGNVTLAPLGDWEQWGVAEATVPLEAGVHQVVLYYGHWNAGAINLDRLELEN